MRVLAVGSTRTISTGSVALPHPATMTGAAAPSGDSIAPNAPRDSRTGVTGPPFAGTEYRRTNPASSAVRYSVRESGAKAKSATERSKPAVTTRGAPVHGHGAHASRSSA